MAEPIAENSPSNFLAAICRDHNTARACVDRLIAFGLAGQDIALLMRDRGAAHELAHHLGARAGVAGGGTGLIEEVREWFEELTNRAGGDQAFGPDLADKLVVHGLSREEALSCVEEVNGGAILLTVRPNADSLQEAYEVLSQTGASVFGNRQVEQIEERHIPLVARLITTTQPVERGEVVVTKTVISEPREMHLHVSHEEAIFQRRPANRLTEQGVAEVETIRIPLYEEHVELVRQPRVVEEIVIRKRLVTEERDVTETVRREVPHVETTGEITPREETEPPQEKELGR